MEWLADPQIWIALLTLTALELVLGIDNVVFISILAGKLPEEDRDRARKVGLGLAMFARVALLFGINWVIHLEETLFTVLGVEISGRDLILIVGGLFLIGKSTREIHGKLEGPDGMPDVKVTPKFANVIGQILLLDIVFSLDSVITAVGMVDHIAIMVAAVVISVIFMFFFARPISSFVEQHPTVKMLALSFLLLIGTALIMDGLDQHIPKGYIYFAMGFSVFVEWLNLKAQKARSAPAEKGA